jgi:predicted flap endonuclease-1-like 5' DNA nuclease
MAPKKKTDSTSNASAKKSKTRSPTGKGVARKTVSTKKPSDLEDDLTIIEGIGKAIQSKLKEAGISTFKKLSATPEKRLRTILENAGPHFRMHDPSSWPLQAKFAANQQWSELKLLQSQLNIRSRLPKATEPAPAAIVALSHVNGGTFQPGQPFRIERLLEPAEVAEEQAARHDELEAEFTKAKKAIRKFLKEPQIKKAIKAAQITGVSARFRTKFGHVVSPLQVVIGVNVSKKLCPLGLARCGLKPIAPIYDGIRVKVVEGTFEQITSKAFFARGNLTPKAPLPFTEEIAGGVPIAPPNDLDDFGTLALVMDITENASSVYIGLTCDHVVGNQFNVHQLGQQNTDRDIGDIRATITPPNRNNKVKDRHSILRFFDNLINFADSRKKKDRHSVLHLFFGLVDFAG